MISIDWHARKPGIIRASAIRLDHGMLTAGPAKKMQTKPGTIDSPWQSSAHEADGAVNLDDTSAARLTHDSQPVSKQRRQASTVPRLLIAYSDERIKGILHPLQEAIGDDSIDQVESGSQLDDALQCNGPYSLVVSQAMLAGTRGLEVLTKARNRGDNTPFILIQSIHQNFVRITLGGGPNSIVSTRLVNTVALIDLVHQMLSAPSSSPTSIG